MKKWAALVVASAMLVTAALPGSAGAVSNAKQAEIVAGVSFREAPSTSGGFIRYLKKGETVTVISQPNAYWYQVRSEKGDMGYVSARKKYINVSAGGSTGGSAGSGPAPAVSKPVGGAAPSQQAERVIAAGMKYLGTPYEFGSDRSTTTTFDCSDFVRQAFIDGVGLKLPADSRSQGQYLKNKGGVITDWTKLKPGDVMFFMSYRGSKPSAYAGVDKSTARITHNGIYLGNGKVLHTYSKEAGGVRIDDLANRHWEYRFLFGGSVL